MSFTRVQHLRPLPLHKRAYDAFLSHAHADKAVVDRIHGWLADTSGVPVWYDATHLSASSRIVDALGQGISESRAAIVVLSEAAIRSGWVQEEYSAAVEQRVSNPDFRIVPVRLGNAAIPTFLQTTKWVELPNAEFGVDQAAELLASLYGSADTHDPGSARDVYVSRTWREAEAARADEICRLAVEYGFRLIGDSRDQHGFADGQRVRSIIASCGAFIAVLPHRGGHTTSQYMLREIEQALALGLPSLIVADHEIQLPEPIAEQAICVGADHEADLTAVDHGLQRLDDEWDRPSAPHRVFFSTPLQAGSHERVRLVTNILQRVTGMPCVVGDDIREGHVQRTIIDAIQDSFLVLADISEENLNTCIEAGVALGAGRPLHLLAAGPRRRPTAFMFRDQQVWYFEDELELLGLVHRIARPYRRRVLNDELLHR